MARNLIVASAQMGPIAKSETRKDTVARLLAMMREAHGRGAKLVVFTEMALTTFFPRWMIEDEAELDSYYETAMPSPTTQALFDDAARLGIGFYLGYAELVVEGGVKRRFNTSILVDQTGTIIGKYRKVHLPGWSEPLPDRAFQHLEKRFFEPGDLGFPVWRTMGGIMGMCICNDRRWPETYRVMSLQSARLVVLGYNTPSVNIHWDEPPHLRMFHHLLSLQANAYQNGLWVAAAGKCGSEDGFHMIGGSAIVSPTGEIVAQAQGEQDEVLFANCNLGIGEKFLHHVFNFAKHRRPEHYRLITDRVGSAAPLSPSELVDLSKSNQE